MAIYRRRRFNRKTYRRPMGRKAAAAATIQRAMRRFRQKKRGFTRYRAITGNNYHVVKVRMQRTLQKNHFRVDTDDSLFFNIFFAPWRNLAATPTTDNTDPQFSYANLFYHPDFKTVLDSQQYDYMRLKGVYLEFRRPKAFMNFNPILANTDTIAETTNPWCTQMIHTALRYQADTTSTELQPNYQVTSREVIQYPNGWNEAIDDGKRTRLHNYSKYAKRVWKPFHWAEKRWMQTRNCELDHSIGGIHIRHKYSIPVANVSAQYERAQALFDITATVYMEFRGRS